MFDMALNYQDVLTVCFSREDILSENKLPRKIRRLLWEKRTQPLKFYDGHEGRHLPNADLKFEG